MPLKLQYNAKTCRKINCVKESLDCYGPLPTTVATNFREKNSLRVRESSSGKVCPSGKHTRCVEWLNLL